MNGCGWVQGEVALVPVVLCIQNPDSIIKIIIYYNENRECVINCWMVDNCGGQSATCDGKLNSKIQRSMFLLLHSHFLFTDTAFRPCYWKVIICVPFGALIDCFIVYQIIISFSTLFSSVCSCPPFDNNHFSHEILHLTMIFLRLLRRCRNHFTSFPKE